MQNQSSSVDPAALAALVRYFETLTRESVSNLPRVYTEDAYFKDPFNEVRGHAAMLKVFEHMFEQVSSPRFIVHSSWTGADGAMLAWDFTFERGGAPMKIRGVSHVRFAPDGRVSFHRDYWDAAEELYAKLPILGGLMRFLARRLRAPL
jgi:steroid Delta-isomerase